jgi:hypothetical protein
MFQLSSLNQLTAQASQTSPETPDAAAPQDWAQNSPLATANLTSRAACSRS